MIDIVSDSERVEFFRHENTWEPNRACKTKQKQQQQPIDGAATAKTVGANFRSMNESSKETEGKNDAHKQTTPTHHSVVDDANVVDDYIGSGGGGGWSVRRLGLVDWLCLVRGHGSGLSLRFVGWGRLVCRGGSLGLVLVGRHL